MPTLDNAGLDAAYIEALRHSAGLLASDVNKIIEAYLTNCQNKSVAEWVKSPLGNYPTLRWKSQYTPTIGDQLFQYPANLAVQTPPPVKQPDLKYRSMIVDPLFHAILQGILSAGIGPSKANAEAIELYNQIITRES